MTGLLKSLARLALRRGMGKGSNGWLAFGALMGLMGWARKKAEEPHKVLHREVLRPGEEVSISVYEPPR